MGACRAAAWCMTGPTFMPEYRVSFDGIPTIEESASYIQYGRHAWVYAVLLPRQEDSLVHAG